MAPSRTDLFMNLPTRGRVYTCERLTLDLYNMIPRLLSSLLSEVLSSRDQFPRKLSNPNVKTHIQSVLRKIKKYYLCYYIFASTFPLLYYDK